MIRRFFKDSFIYSISNILTAGFGVIMMPIYTRTLSQSDYGVIDMAGIFFAFATIILGFEMPQAISKFYSKYKGDEQIDFLRTCISFSVLTTFSVALLSILFCGKLSLLLFNSNAYKFVIVIAAIGYFFSKLFSNFTIVMRNSNKVSLVAVLSIVSSILTLGFTIWFVVDCKLGIIGVFYGNLISSMSIALVVIFKYPKFFKFKISKVYLLTILKFTTPLVFSGLSIAFINYTDRIIIDKYVSLSEVGIYGVASRISSIVSLVLFGFTSAIVPLTYSSAERNDSPYKIEKIFSIFLGFSAILILIVSFFSNFIILTFTNSTYLRASNVVTILLLLNLSSSVGYFFPGLFIKGKTKIVALNYFFIAMLNLLLNLIFTPKYGMSGSSISSLISTLIGMVVTVYFSQKFYHIPININKYFRFIVAFIFMIILNFFLDFFVINLFLSACIKITCIILFTFYLFIANFFSYTEFLNEIGSFFYRLKLKS